jgi:hypothetical protein
MSVIARIGFWKHLFVFRYTGFLNRIRLRHFRPTRDCTNVACTGFDHLDSLLVHFLIEIKIFLANPSGDYLCAFFRDVNNRSPTCSQPIA